MDELQSQIIQYTARRLLGTYVQGGELDMYAIDDALARSNIAIGQYEIQDLRTLVRLGFLCSKPTRRFAADIVGQMQMLRVSNQRRFGVIDGHVRGAINWSQTIPLQVTRPTCFVCADPERAFDLPENHMLRAVVESHSEDLERVLTYWPQLPGQASSGWRLELDKLSLRLHAIKSNPYYRRIPGASPGSGFRLPSRLVQRVRRRRGVLAALILRQYLAYQAACGDAAEPSSVHRAVIDGLRWPNPDKLFELFTLFSLVQLLHQNGVAPPCIAPIYSRATGDGWFGRLRADEVLVTVYYQTMPPDLRIQYGVEGVDPSIRDYATTLRLYGARLGSLRPDVVIDCQKGMERRLLLVEVKHSGSAPTIRQGLRELVDYCHLVRSRTSAETQSIDVRGLLCVLDLPTPKLRFPADSIPGNYAITSASRLLATLQWVETSDELRRIIAFCWFA